MIIYQDKGFEINSRYPSENFYPDAENVIGIVDESTEEGLEIARQIIQLYPNYRVTISEGIVVGIEEVRPGDPEYVEPVSQD